MITRVHQGVNFYARLNSELIPFGVEYFDSVIAIIMFCIQIKSAQICI